MYNGKKRGPKGLDDATKARLVEASRMVDEGSTLHGAAALMDVTYSQLQGHRKRNQKVPKRTTYSAEIKRRAVHLVQSGMRVSDAASKVGTSIQSVERWVGLAARPEPEVIPSGHPKATHVYTIDGQNFGTLEECTRYAVAKVGGITLTRSITEEIHL